MSDSRGPEALSWLRSNRNPNPLATNHFQTAHDAIEAVKQLYATGAIEVHVGPTLEEPERIRKEGGPYSDGLDITFPREKTKQIMALVDLLKPDSGGRPEDIIKDEGEYWRLMLWWD